jgi:hypothetical protein
MFFLFFIILTYDSIENSDYGNGACKFKSLSNVQFIRTMLYNSMPSPMLVFFWLDVG